MLSLDEIITGEKHDEELEKIGKAMLKRFNPKEYAGRHGYEIQYEKSFERACAILEDALHIANPKDMTVFQFYERFEVIKERSKQIKNK